MVRLPRLTPSARASAHLALQVLLSLALFGVLQLLATRHNVRFDLTPTQAFVLSDQAKQIAAALEAPVRITAFYNTQQSGQRRAMLDLLEQFRAASPLIDFRLADLDRSPGLATRYGVSSYNSGVIESDGRILTLQAIDESEITNALLKLSSREPRTLCFLTGHGERNPNDHDERAGYSEVAKALERENFDIETLTTVPSDGVPPYCTVVVAAGPSHDWLPGEADQLGRYLEDGGRVLLLVDPDAPPSVTEFLRRFGVEAGDDLIVDDRNRFFGADSFMPRVPIFEQGTFRGGLEAAAVFSLARTVLPRDDPAPNLTVSPIAMSSAESWALVGAGPTPDDEVRFRKGVDRRGPLPVAAMVRVHDRTNGGDPMPREGRMIVFGDSDFATNFYLNLLGNRDLFMSTVAVLSEDPELIAVRRKGMTRGTMSPITLTAFQGRVIFWTAVVAQPLAFMIAGSVVALSRRRRRGGR